MQISQQQHGAVTVVRPQGPLAGADAEQFKTETLGAGRAALGRVVIDAAGIPMCDSRGLEVLVELAQEMGASGQSLRLCGAVETVRETLEITEVAHHFEHYTDVQQAVRSFL